jgi:hypothetical protein
VNPPSSLRSLAIPEARWLYANPVDRLKKEVEKFHWMQRAKSRRHQITHELARRAQVLVKMRLRWLGYAVLSTSHKCPYDLVANQLRIEVKAARWDGKRYGARIHNSQCNFLIWLILSNRPTFYVIPAHELAGIKYLKITSQDPARSTGRWAKYREAWRLLEVEL